MSPSEKLIVDLFRSHNRELNGFARRRVGPQEAEDIVQEAYLHLLQEDRLASLQYPRAYLFRVASNLAVDLKRKTRIRSQYVVEDVEAEGSATRGTNSQSGVEGVMEVIRLQVCLGRLPPLCRAIFLLNRLDGLSYPEIAARLGVSVRTVNRNMTKASDYLCRHLDRGG